MKKRIVVLLLIAVIILVFEVVYIVNFENSSDGGGGSVKYVPALIAQAHNSMFDSYIDKTVKGKQIKELCAKMARYNEYADEGFAVTIIYRADGEEYILADGNGFGYSPNADEQNILKINANSNYICEPIYTSKTIDTDVLDIITKIIVTKEDIKNNKKIQKNE